MSHNQTIDLCAERGRLFLTVREAAELAGVSRRTWQRWEKASCIPAGALKRFSEQYVARKSAEKAETST